MNKMLRGLFLIVTPLALAASSDWPVYGGDAGTSRYSPLKQINTGNASKLQVAWTFHTGDSTDRPATQIQCTPIVIDGVMYVTSAQLKVIALRADNGQKLWTYDPFAGSDDERPRGVNRGVSYWASGKDKRILFTYRSKLVSLDAKTGKPSVGFGDNGQVDLTQGLDRDISGLAYYITTPGVVFKDLLILGSTTGEGPRLSAPGHVRGFDVRTGKQKWIFHTIPHPGEYGYETWSPDSWKYSGGTNVWGGLTVDTKRGMVFLATGSPTFDFWGGDRIGDNLFGNSVVALNAETGKRIWHFQVVHDDVWGGLTVDTKRGMVFLATGSPTFDFWGGDRIGDNLFGNSVVALNAETGKRIWHFQVVHHDVWDYDLANAPTLVTLERDGKKVD